VEIRRILCPVDFSEASSHAVDQAIAIAGWYKARLTGLHVCVPVFAPAFGMSAPADRVPQPEQQRAHLQLGELFRRAAAAGIDTDMAVDAGEPASVILERAARLPADMIVMGTHGASGFQRFMVGSVTEKVLRRAPCPVLAVPPRAQATAQLPFKRVLCAVDFSEWSDAALEIAGSFATQCRADLVVTHVVEWPWHEPPAPTFGDLPPEQAAALAEYRRYIEASATDRLKSLVSNLSPSVAVRAVVRHGKPYVEILRVASDDHADLIVIGVHGRNPIDLTLFGSTAHQVVRRATCPVLTLRR
jgi:nucleotide-binding universal stress UspA family protein